MFSTSARARLLATSVICGAAALGASSGAFAQETAAEAAELVVTGSRLPRPNLQQPTPVQVLSPRMIEDAGAQSLGDLIARLPQAGYAGTLRANANNFGNDAGVSSADLRGLGVSRTLVLVDGQRHVAGDLMSNAVDLNANPPALVERVEIITGGASAIYGSDAVTGVVNIITKKRFEGVAAEAQLGGYDNGFGGRYSASVTAGRNFLDERLNLAVSGFWRKEAGIDVRDVPGANNYGLIINPADVPPGQLDPSFRGSGAPIPNNGVPDRIYAPNIASELTTLNGVLVNGRTGAAIVFDAAGNPVAAPRRTGYLNFGYGQIPNCGVCFRPEDYKQLASPLETGGLALNANMEFGPRLRGFMDAKFVQNDVENVIQPSVTAEYVLRRDNAFLTPALQAMLGPSSPLNPWIVSRFLDRPREQEIRRRTYRLVAGLEGAADAGFAEVNWTGALNYGQTDTRLTLDNLRITGNFIAALDSVIDPATGRPACRINVPSAGAPSPGATAATNPQACVPYNPFGQRNTAEALAYSFGRFETRDRLTQQVASLNASFDTSRFLNLQGGPLGVAVGAEYRMERTRERHDEMLAAGLTENRVANSSGGYNVSEVFAEVSAPILREAGPLRHELTVDAAWRGADYSTVGGVSAYKLSGVYGPASWLKLRGTYARAIRAPNITEAFLPVSPTTFTLRDPCSVETIGSNVNYAANCQAAGLPPNFVATSSLSTPGELSGNAALDPETSTSYTVGAILQPASIPGLAVSLDYYSIKIKDAIIQVEGQDIVNNCYGSSGGLDPTYCSLFRRSTDGRHLLSFVRSTYVNASRLITEGFELQVNYAADVAPLTQRWAMTRGLDGQASFSLSADYVLRLRNFPFQQNPGQVNVLEGTANSTFGNNPQLKAIADLTYVQGGASVGWSTRFIGRQALYNRDPSATQGAEAVNIPFTEAVFYHDLTVRYRLGGQGGATELFAGAQNLFDEQVPFTVLGTKLGLAYDPGRFLFVGARYRR